MKLVLQKTLKKIVMKKILMITLLSLSAIGLHAQATSRTPQLGVKGGVNISSFTGDDFGEVDSRTSFNAGLLAELPLSERFSIQPELLYSGQGFDIQSIDEDNFLDTDDNIEYQLDYLQMPLLAKVYLISGLSIEAGPVFNVKINEEIDYQPNDDDGDINIDPDNSAVKDFDLGLAAGASYKFGTHFFVSGRYNYGFTKILKDSDVDVRNSVWQFGLGFMF